MMDIGVLARCLRPEAVPGDHINYAGSGTKAMSIMVRTEQPHSQIQKPQYARSDGLRPETRAITIL